MIDFRKLTIEDRDRFIEFIKKTPNKTPYSFAATLMWGEAQVADFPGGMGFLYTYEGRTYYLYPVGDCDVKSIIESYMEDAKERKIEFSMDELREDESERLERLFPGRFDIEYNLNHSDYIYDINDLAELKGRKYHKKKNHVNKFAAEFPNHCLVSISEKNFDKVRIIAKKWYELRDDDYSEEKRAIEITLDNYHKLDMDGAILVADGKPLAMTMASRMSADTFDVHFEKSIDETGVAYAMINREFAKMIRAKYPDVKYLNREEDLGIEHLKMAKESYHPHHMLKKYKAVLK